VHTCCYTLITSAGRAKSNSANLRRRNPGRAGATLVEGQLSQGPFWREWFADSANTFRLLILWTPDEPARSARAVQRIGTAVTVPTDNWSGGAGDGHVGEGWMHPLKGKRAEQQFSHHPARGGDCRSGERTVQPNIVDHSRPLVNLSSEDACRY
jgi:hypothetical protein